MKWKFWKKPPSLNLFKNVKRYRPVVVCHEVITAIIATIAAWWGTTAVTVVGVAITWGTIIKAILIVGCVWFSYSQSQKAKKTGQARDFRASGHLMNTVSQSEPMPIPYGTCRIGGNVVYKNCTGTDNKYYHRIITFGYGPVKGPKNDAPAVTSAERARFGSGAHIKTATAHGLKVGDWAVVSGMGGTGYNGTWWVDVVYSPTWFAYGNPGDDEGWTADTGGTISGGGVASAERARIGSGVHIKTATPHGLEVGYLAVVSGMGGAGYNGTWPVLFVASPTWFGYFCPGEEEAWTADTGGTISGGGGDKIYLDGARIQTFGNLAYWEFFTGTPTQTVCATLQADHPEFDDAMRDIAYLYLRLEYNTEKFVSDPQVTIEGEWRKLYDPRDGQTVFSANNALVAYDFLRSDLYSIGLPEVVFDEDLIKDAANWCEANDYQFNGPIMERQSLLDNLEVILQNFRAGLTWSEGLYKLLVYEYDIPVMHLTEDDIEADSFKISGPGIPETPNRVLITYIDAVNNYVSKTKPIEDPQAVLNYDGEERDFELDLKGVTNALQAEKLGIYYIERNRLNYQFPLVAHPRTLALDPMDMIQITHSMPGWTEKIVRVIDAEPRQDGKVNLLVLVELASLYDDVANIETHNAYKTNLPALFRAPELMENKDVPDGYAPLDGDSLVPLANLPMVLTGIDADLIDGQHRILTINADHTHQSTGAMGGKLDHGLALDGLSDDDHAQYSKADGTRAFIGVVSGLTPTQNAHLATKEYVDTMGAGIGLDPVLDRYDPTGGLPTNPTTGDRYLSTATANGWTINRLYEYNGATWDEEIPSAGDTVLVIDEATMYAYTGSAWISLAATDHGALNGLADDDHTQYQLRSEKGIASGYCDLDASVLVPLARIPSILTGKDADTLDTKHYSNISAEIDGDISTHAALTTGVHGVGASNVESASGSQAKVDTHAGLTTAHAAATNLEKVANKGAASGYAGLGADSKVPDAQSQVPSTHPGATTGVHGVGASSVESASGSQAKVDTHAGLTTAHAAATNLEKVANKGAASGYAGLDSTTKVPLAQFASGTPDGTKFVRDDRTLAVPASNVPTGSQGDTIYKGSSAWLAGKMWINAKSYGAVGDGTSNDTTAIQAAIDALGTAGGTVLLPPPGKYLIDTALTVNKNVTLRGPFSFVGSKNASDYGNISCIIVNSAYTITLQSGAGIEGCLVYRKGISFPVNGPAAFAGTAITILANSADDCFVFNSMILGFNKLIYSTGNQRPHIFNVQGDGINGIEIINCLDVGYIKNVHLWPFAIYPSEGEYKRTGTAFKFTTAGDWNKVTDCFSWGYKYGFRVDSCNNMTLLSCGADNPGDNTDSIGFVIAGSSNDTRLIGCQAAGQYNCGYFLGATSGQNTRLMGCDSWGNVEHCILVSTGDVSITGGNLRDTPNGITINNATSKVLIDQVENLCTTPINYITGNPYVVVGFIDTGSGWYVPELTIPGGVKLQSDGHILLNNTKGLYGKDAGGNTRELIDINSGNAITIGNLATGDICIGYGATPNDPIWIRVGGGWKKVTIDGSGFLKGV